MMENQFIDKSVNIKAVDEFYKKMEKIDYEVHTLQIYKDNKCMLRIAKEPYSCTDAREVYSLSKTFTSTVVGIAYDMGLLSDEDYVLDYFPEIKTVSPYFKKLKIKHVLSMNTGHGGCVMEQMRLAENSFEGFFSVEPEFEPGTHFAYNTGATCLLGDIIERATGESFFDFACEKLFYPMEIHNISWSRCHDGGAQCGVGLHISSDDIVKLGLMYLNKGVYNGKRIISEEWIDKATAFVSDNSGNGSPDWTSGYGYQIWLNRHDGYRGDGAFGQLCVVFPKYNAVFVVQGEGPSMQDEMDMVYDLMNNLIGDGSEIKSYKFEPIPYMEKVTPVNKIIKLKENKAGFKTMHLVVSNDLLTLSFSNGSNIQTICAGNGKWIKSQYCAKHMIPLIGYLMTTEYDEIIRTASCFKVEDNKIIICVRYLTNPHTEYFEIDISDDCFKLYINNKRNLRPEELKIFTENV